MNPICEDLWDFEEGNRNNNQKRENDELLLHFFLI